MKNVQRSPYKGNILVVDDTLANLRLLVAILKQQGYQVRPVPNGKMAISGAQGLPPDLILLDIMMPEMDGYEVCRRLKADSRTRDIPVIFISATQQVIDKVRAFEAGGIDYISKPFQVEEVVARVDTHLAIRLLQTSLEAKNADLENTVEQLKAAQTQLIQSEKMAVLGQLGASITHEINSPLGAIRSSIHNISNFLASNLYYLPDFFQGLSPERQQDFFSLLQRSSATSTFCSSREQRQYKAQLVDILKSYQVSSPESIADILVEIGVYNSIEPYLNLFASQECDRLLKMLYQFSILQRSTQNIELATERAAKVIFALKSYAHYESTESKSETNLVKSIETVLTLYQHQLKQGVEVIRHYPSEANIIGYPDELNQVWTNLIQNALNAMDNKGILTIDISSLSQNIMVKITDSGKGIPEKIQTKIFEPFFTTKPPGQGSGLGLDIVRKIINKHEGQIEVMSVPGQTTFSVLLPTGCDS